MIWETTTVNVVLTDEVVSEIVDVIKRTKRKRTGTISVDLPPVPEEGLPELRAVVCFATRKMVVSPPDFRAEAIATVWDWLHAPPDRVGTPRPPRYWFFR